MLRCFLQYSRLIALNLICSCSLVVAQETANAGFASASFDGSEREVTVAKSEPSENQETVNRILADFLDAERRVRQELNRHTFKREVVLQTIGLSGEVTGEYIRKSQFVFDDRGNRIERVLFHPPSTIREVKITREDIQDLAGAQLLGIDISEASKYVLSFGGQEIIDSRRAYVINVRPRNTPDPHRMKDRFFVGRIWIDAVSLQILRVQGIAEPQGKQRFPRFQAWRETVAQGLIFPTRTEADDILHFPKLSVHCRIKVRYYDYKRFASTVNITEVNGSPVE